MDRRLRELVVARAERCCEYCRLPQNCDPIPFEIDHIIPQKHGGPTESENLALACFACNNHKGPNLAGLDSETNEIVPLFHPRRDDWRAHFGWDGGRLLGLTPCGRVTIAVLAINLVHRMAHRQALSEEGVWPQLRHDATLEA
jgi:hypothetical protein